jgi:transcriptional regulator with XRE-family HTH domain
MPNQVMEFPLDGYIRRARRRADMSQRELAKAAGVSAATVARVESGSLVPSMTTFRKLLEACALRLVVVDLDGRLVLPMEVWDDTTDGALRRYPAHLDVVLDPEQGEWWGDLYGLFRPPETFRRDRKMRDRIRALSQQDVDRKKLKGPTVLERQDPWY